MKIIKWGQLTLSEEGKVFWHDFQIELGQSPDALSAAELARLVYERIAGHPIGEQIQRDMVLAMGHYAIVPRYASDDMVTAAVDAGMVATSSTTEEFYRRILNAAIKVGATK